MPHLLVYGAIAAVGYLGFRAFVREAQRVTEATRKAEAKRREKAGGKPAETLIYDEETGTYRVKDES